MSTKIQTNRVIAGAAELIDRSQTIEFKFNGKRFTAHPGDSIASALAANGVKVIGRSFKYHRPRGLMAYGHATNTMVQIGDEPSVSIWLRRVEDGMVVKPVNAWPSVDRDVMSLTQMGDKFMPVGFYYKTFIRPQRLWPTYEKILRNAAGLGRLNRDVPLAKGFLKQYLHGDVVVVGAGPAGLSAAHAAAEAGARVLLFDEAPYLGGHWRYSGEDPAGLGRLVTAVSTHPNIHSFTNTLVTSWFEDHWLAAVCEKMLYKVRGKATIFATGALDQPILFDNNDLPGVMVGSAARRLLHLYGVVPGEKVLIVTANDDGWKLAQALKVAGVDVVGVADHRAGGSELGDEIARSGVPVYWQHTIAKAHGKKEVTAAEIAPLDNLNTRRVVACDTIILSTNYAPDNQLLYLAGGRFEYDETRHEFLPKTMPDSIFAAGRLTGTHDLTTEQDEGRLKGLQAAAFLRLGNEPGPQEKAAVTRRKNAEPVRSSDLMLVVGDKNGKRFIDFDEDVTDKELKDAIAEGYDSMQLLKRYSTISMGPSQGKWASINTIHLAAGVTAQTIAQTGTTTARSPVRPLKLGNLAGQMMDPVKVTAVHDWHVAQGAKMMVAGLWLRPEHYGDAAAEVKAVRERVGMIDVCTLGKIKLTGPGVPALLDKLYINKFSNLKVGRVRYGVMVNAEGVVMDDGVTARVGEQEWYMTTTSSGAASVFEWIQWWAQSGWGEGVHVTRVSEGKAAFNLAGPASRRLLQKLTDADLSNEAFPYMHVRHVELAGVPCRLMRIGFTGELSYEIHCGAGYGRFLWTTILEAGKKFDLRPFGVEAQRILRLEKGHIIIGADTDALSNPFGAELGWAVKLDKDDFLGQRALIDIAAKGGSKQKLTGFKMVDATIVPEEGLQVVQPKEGTPLGLETIGWVSSSRFSPTLNESIGLCWLPTELAEQVGATFTIRRDGELVAAVVYRGAFYDPSGSKLRV
ncbi:MAG: FAD-dependent oxidoreductase [Chloroflexi bacterium]|nr:MAG: FAD-dependent oxidoreductase [Chloroflexota bacterium]